MLALGQIETPRLDRGVHGDWGVGADEGRLFEAVLSGYGEGVGAVVVVGSGFAQALLQVGVEPDLEDASARVYFFGVGDAIARADDLHVAG
jgi:hypothetical protein